MLTAYARAAVVEFFSPAARLSKPGRCGDLHLLRAEIGRDCHSGGWICCRLRSGYPAELAGFVGEQSLDKIGMPDGYCSGFCRLLLSPFGEMSR
jgi:hypothetical protein